MISYKRMEERVRIGSDLPNKPFSDFSLFNNLTSDKQMKTAFLKMQDIYVFNEKDEMEYERLVDKIGSLYEVLLSLDEGLEQ